MINIYVYESENDIREQSMRTMQKIVRNISKKSIKYM
jgi:hypothetical protein